MINKRNFCVDVLLVQDGDRYFVDAKGNLEVIIKVTRVAKTPRRPHGLKYSLVLLNTKGERLVCFDNAHAVSGGSGPGKKNSKQFDHIHIGNRVTPYEFKDANTLVMDFWHEVDKLVLV